jgi:hypothetical protein
MGVYLFSGVNYLTPNDILIAGGINSKFNDIKKEAYLFHPLSRSFVRLPDMFDIRYTFTSQFYNGRFYVLGGRVFGSDEDALLRKCEFFDLGQRRWVRMSDLNIQRATAVSAIYNDEIYVFGGYTGKFQRKRQIEKYNIQ